MLALYAPKQQAVEIPNLGKIGDIKQSVLTEAQFQAIHGAVWTLMDGKSVVGSIYETLTGNSTIPDGRGQFVRIENNGRTDGKENPDATPVGAQQDQATKPNGLLAGSNTSSDGAHNHSTASGYCGQFGNATSGGITQLNGCHGGTRDATSTHPAHTHTVNVTDGSETRPKNITANYFIKID